MKEIKVKTVWHWKNIGKGFLLLTIGIGLYVLLASYIPFLGFFSAPVGIILMLIVLLLWDLWDFKVERKNR